MRVPKTMPAVAVLLVVATAAVGQEKPTLDDLLTRLAAAKKDGTEFRRKAADSDKLAAELANEARELIDALKRRLDELHGPPAPMPPGPGPTPPPPVVDPLRKKVADAFALDAGSPADKKQWAAALSGYYEAAVELKLADDATIQTAGDLTARIRATVTLPPDKLVTTRTAIGQELAALLGTASTPLSAEARKALPLLFTRIAAALDEVSK